MAGPRPPRGGAVDPTALPHRRPTAGSGGGGGRRVVAAARRERRVRGGVRGLGVRGAAGVVAAALAAASLLVTLVLAVAGGGGGGRGARVPAQPSLPADAASGAAAVLLGRGVTKGGGLLSRAGRLLLAAPPPPVGGAPLPAVAPAAAATVAARGPPGGGGRGGGAAAAPGPPPAKLTAAAARLTSDDYSTSHLPRREKGEAYFYTRLLLSQPTGTVADYQFVKIELRKLIGIHLGGVPADQVEAIRFANRATLSTPTRQVQAVSIFLALPPNRLTPDIIVDFNDWVKDDGLTGALQAASNNAPKAAMYWVREDQPLQRDWASVASHGPSGAPLSRPPPLGAAGEKRKSKVPLIAGAVGGVLAVVAAVAAVLYIHSRRGGGARGASPRDLTRYSEESGSRQSSFPSSLASLPLPSFRASVERPRNVHPDDGDLGV